MMTKDDISRQVQELSIEQQNAIDILIQGASDRETAELCGVARQTVNTWRNQNTAFIAALNRRRLDVWNSQTDKLRALVSVAVDVLKADLACEDARLRQAAAVHILRAVGLYGTDMVPSGATSEEGVQLDLYFSSLR